MSGELKPFITPIGVVLWSQIHKPSTKFSKSGEYIIDVEFDKSELSNIAGGFRSIVKTFVDGLVQEKKISSRTRIVYVNLYRTETATTSVIRAKQYTKNLNSKFHKIPLVDSEHSPISGITEEIAKGERVRVKIYPKPYFSAKNNSVGISFRINEIQLLSWSTKPTDKKAFSAKISIDDLVRLEKAKAEYFSINHKTIQNDEVILRGINAVISDLK